MVKEEIFIVISKILVIDHQTLPKRRRIKNLWHLKISPMTAQGVSKYGPRNQSTETCAQFPLEGTDVMTREEQEVKLQEQVRGDAVHTSWRPHRPVVINETSTTVQSF